MPKLPTNLALHSRTLYSRSLLHSSTTFTARYATSSSQSAIEQSTDSALDSNTKTNKQTPPDQSNQNNDDPTKITIHSDEYSKSGGDDVVAHQVVASFKNSKTTDPAQQKEQAGKGNEVNPLEVSPATPEISAAVEEVVIEKDVGEGGKKGASGMGQGRKGRKVEHTQIDLEKIRMRGR